jgi:hypothetical protein
MFSALLMVKRLAGALRVALREETSNESSQPVWR